MYPMLQQVAETVPWMQRRADALDREARFPAEEIDRLRRAGALWPPMPALGSANAEELAALLILVGQGNLSVGRILEAHVNALHLIARFGRGTPLDDGRSVRFVGDRPTHRRTAVASGRRADFPPWRQAVLFRRRPCHRRFGDRPRPGRRHPHAGSPARHRRNRDTVAIAAAGHARGSDRSGGFHRLRSFRGGHTGRPRRLSARAGFLRRRMARISRRAGRPDRVARSRDRADARSPAGSTVRTASFGSDRRSSLGKPAASGSKRRRGPRNIRPPRPARGSQPSAWRGSRSKQPAWTRSS